MHAHTFETILVPIDFSDISSHALRTASLMAAHCGSARVIAMYANWFEAPPYFTVGRLAELQAEFRESVQLAERSLSAFVRSTLGGQADSFEVRVVEALPADGIRQLAIQMNADLIVMGTHGRSGLNRWMLGSVAERVLRESPVPVLTVRSAPREPIRQVLCPVHDTELSRRSLRFAGAGISACFNASLTVLYVHEPSELVGRYRICVVGSIEKSGRGVLFENWSATEGAFWGRRRRSSSLPRKNHTTWWFWARLAGGFLKEWSWEPPRYGRCAMRPVRC